MLFFVISMLIIVTLLILANDIMFNKRRLIGIKIIEFIICVALIYYLFVSTSTYIVKKNNIEHEIKENSLLNSPMVEYNIDGTIKGKDTIGGFLYKHFVHDVFDAHTQISKSEYLKNNIIVMVVACIYLVYWIVLLLLFEKEETSGYKIVSDEELLDKYNPLMAACISQNRNVMCRDIIGLILNLIDRKKINLRVVPDENAKVVGYRYMISENTESDLKLDMIEKEIYDWMFEEIPNFIKGSFDYDYIKKSKEGIIEIDLVKRIKAITESEDTYGRLKELNYNVKKRLQAKGANKESVPPLLKLLNNILIIISVCLVANHILKNGMDITITDLQIVYAMFIMIFAIVILPVIYVFSLVCIEFMRVIFRVLHQVTEGYTGRQLIAKSISIALATFIVIAIYAIFAKDYYIIYDIFLLGVTALIIFTDDYMLKHDSQILNDFYNLKRIEKKLEEYSLMKNENIEYMKLWDKYYAYAVAFGIPSPVNEEIETVYDNTKIVTKPNVEAVYYVCKNYLEVMWDMEFYDNKSKIDILKFL